MGGGSVVLTPVHYFVDKKNREHGEAIAAGFGAVKVPAENRRLESGALHLIGGLAFGSLELMRQARDAGEPYVFFDRAYFGGGPGTGRLRAVPHAYQKNWIGGARAPGRARRFGVELRPWRSSGRHIMLVSPGAAICDLFGLGDWEAETLARLKRSTCLPVMVSRKPDAVPMTERLRDCWCVVTWTSNVAVEAIVAGVPAFVCAESAAAPVAGNLTDLERLIESPPRPDREAWAESLAWGQFDLDEIRSGFARRVILDPLIIGTRLF